MRVATVGNPNVGKSSLINALAGSDLQVNLAAVIERKDGQFEYWTLRHVAAQPDFHARETFVLTLATAARKAD